MQLIGKAAYGHKGRVAIRPVFAGTVPFLGLGPSVRPSLPLCPGIFDSIFSFVNMSTTQTSHLLYSDPLLLCGLPIADSPFVGSTDPHIYNYIIFFFNIKCYFLIFCNILFDFLIIVLIISGIVNSIVMRGLNNSRGRILKVQNT